MYAGNLVANRTVSASHAGSSPVTSANKMNKDFRQELRDLNFRLAIGDNFSLVRVSDAESYVLDNRQEYIRKPQHDYDWNPNDLRCQFARERLLEATQYTGDNYFIGLPTHGDKAFFDRMKAYTKCDPQYLTHATLFMDGNYQFFINTTYELLKERPVILVCNEKAIAPEDLNVIGQFYIGYSAYMMDGIELNGLVNNIKEVIISSQNVVVLVGAGIFSNILIHKLHQAVNATFIDVGSALDYKLGLGHTRSFFDKNHPSANKMFPWYG